MIPDCLPKMNEILRVDSNCKVSKVHAKRTWNDGRGDSLKNFRESFERIDRVITYRNSDEQQLRRES